MRKIFIAAALAGMLSGTAFASDGETEKVYIPQKGDIAFGVDLIPLFRTISDAFDNREHKDPGFIGGDPFKAENAFVKPNVAISAKYMLTDRLAVAGVIGFTGHSNTVNSYVADDLATQTDPLSQDKVTDSEKTTVSGGSLMAGVEYRMGKRRVQGIFGGGLLMGFSTKHVSYSYGNALTDINQNPTTSINQEAFGNVPDGYRVLDNRTDGPMFALGVYGKMGVECFVAPKVAIGASVDIYVYGNFGANAYTKSEGFNKAYNRVEERTDLIKGAPRGINFGTDNIGGSLYMAFYF